MSSWTSASREPWTESTPPGRYSEDSTLQRAKLAEPCGYILKPFDDRELRSSIEIALCRHAAEEEIRRLNRLYDVLSQVNQAIVRIRTREELLPTVCRLVVERGAMDLAWIGWLDPESQRLSPVAHFGEHGEMLGDTGSPHADGSTGQSSPLHAIREGRPFICNACGSGDCPYGGEASPASMGLQSCGSFPIRFQGEIAGVLTLCAREPHLFRDREIALLEEVALDISFALDKIEGDAQRVRAEQALRQPGF
ncbi:MAG: GAF domain-containing protein [Syntrophobacteraceae bacterium]|nr:GAF domain-containing protein [Syntrophobacteraceae bacterium]